MLQLLSIVEDDRQFLELGRLCLRFGHEEGRLQAASALVRLMEAKTYDPLSSLSTLGEDLQLLETFEHRNPAKVSPLLDEVAKHLDALTPEVANPLLPPMCAKGCRTAQGSWGLRLLEGRGMSADFKAGLKLVQKSERPWALLRAAIQLKGRDLDTAYRLALRAKQGRNPEADFCLGQVRLKQGEQSSEAFHARTCFSEAHEHFEAAAKGGFPLAYLELARMYALGRGLPGPSMTKAHEWALKAAEAGQAEGFYWAGWTESSGLAGKPDPVAAAVQFRRGAQAEDSRSAFRLACALKKGEGVPMDIEGSQRMMNQAADLGSRDAANELAIGLLDLGKDAEASIRFRQAAEAGLSAAQIRLARLWAENRGGAKDENEARTWLAKSAGQEDPDGIFQLALMDLGRARTRKDIDPLIDLLRHAAQMGHAEATELLRLWRF